MTDDSFTGEGFSIADGLQKIGTEVSKEAGRAAEGMRGLIGGSDGAEIGPGTKVSEIEKSARGEPDSHREMPLPEAMKLASAGKFDEVMGRGFEAHSKELASERNEIDRAVGKQQAPTREI